MSERTVAANIEEGDLSHAEPAVRQELDQLVQSPIGNTAYPLRGTPLLGHQPGFAQGFQMVRESGWSDRGSPTKFANRKPFSPRIQEDG